MNKIDKILGKYFLFALPLTGLFSVAKFLYETNGLLKNQTILTYLNNFFGLILMVWILVSFYLVIKMIIKKSFRDQTLKKLMRIKDGDERESLISGSAAKMSMLSTFALMTLLLFLSTMTLSIGKIQGEKLLQNNENHFISISFEPFFMNKEHKILNVKNQTEVLTYSALPLPTSIILLLLFCWQLTAFHLIARKNLNT
jgi:hypothetical protein